MSISTMAPGILQPADVTTMSEKMQKLDTITRAVYCRATKDGGVATDMLQTIMEGVKDLLAAAPRSVFTESITAVPEEGAPAAGGGAGGAATSSAAPPAAYMSVAAARARHDAREIQRRILEKQAHVERRADQLLLQEAHEAADAAAAPPISTTVAQHQVGVPVSQAQRQRRAEETPGLGDDDMGHYSVDAIMALPRGEAPAAA